ncbi:MAG: glycosyltransferase family 1 protein, partial [Bacteroidota bacterium]
MIVFLNSHPIQYFAPLYQNLTQNGLDVEIWYASKHGIAGEKDREFGTKVKWDIPILEGYQYRFLSNQSFRPSIYRFWGLANWSVLK